MPCTNNLACNDFLSCTALAMMLKVLAAFREGFVKMPALIGIEKGKQNDDSNRKRCTDA